MIQIKSGTVEWESCPSNVAKSGYVLFAGTFAYAADGVTANMVWDATLNGGVGNVRAMTGPEIAALPAQKQAARDAGEPDLATLRDQATQAVVDINTYLAIASPTNAQVVAEVRALDIRQRAIIKALARLAIKVL